MKISEKVFHIYAGERPKVLLMGNGLCRAFDGMSWNDLLDEIKDPEDFPLEARRYLMPMPLKAAMLTKNKLTTRMKEIVDRGARTKGPKNSGRTSWKDFTRTNPGMREQIRRLIGSGFDYVLTTNYSYEIEAALLNAETLTPAQIKKMMSCHEVDHPQTQFLINTFNLAEGTSVWHIHGEARKPGSMIIGSYYYGKLLKRCIERLDGTGQTEESNRSERTRQTDRTSEFRRNIREEKAQKIGSWVDAFVLGDVWILGLGMDFSEADLWWLLEYKKNHPDICGKTFFLEARKSDRPLCAVDDRKQCEYFDAYVDRRMCRDLLLKTYDVEIRSLGLTVGSREDYKAFYAKAAESLKTQGAD